MKWYCEIVKASSGGYYANMQDEQKGVGISGANYRELSERVKEQTGRELPKLKDLIFKPYHGLHRWERVALVQNCYTAPSCCVEHTDENFSRAIAAIKEATA